MSRGHPARGNSGCIREDRSSQGAGIEVFKLNGLAGDRRGRTISARLIELSSSISTGRNSTARNAIFRMTMLLLRFIAFATE
jgi:hypothetical protein